MKLSILICTIPERVGLFALLKEHLREQINELGVQRDVEIVSDDRPRGTISVGAKRQSLLERAQGDYVVFIDDDDWVPYHYVARVAQAIDQNPDCIGYKEVCKGMSGPRGPDRTAIHSNKYLRWCDKCYGVDHVRTIFHKDPVRRNIALKIGFKDMKFGEDHEYSQRLKRELVRMRAKEVFIDEVMYEYRYSEEPHDIKYGITT